MQPRIDYTKYAQEAQKAMFGLERYIAESGLDHGLIHFHLQKTKRTIVAISCSRASVHDIVVHLCLFGRCSEHNHALSPGQFDRSWTDAGRSAGLFFWKNATADTG